MFSAALCGPWLQLRNRTCSHSNALVHRPLDGGANAQCTHGQLSPNRPLAGKAHRASVLGACELFGYRVDARAPMAAAVDRGSPIALLFVHATTGK